MKPARMQLPAPVDPDLERAIAELAFTVRRIRDVESMLIDPNSKHYPRLMQMIHERADLWQEVANRAEKLNLPTRALGLIVEEADRLRKRRGRKAPLADVLRAVEVLQEQVARDRQEAAVELRIMQLADGRAQQRVDAAAGARTYLEACRA
ncbi:hypothetical protein GGQ80_002047 [Sphingomonas jinjuensis]|uniref:Uncharacterized protein n=1 Tax=Sphingomonas jinjuensis TaxID=535907 RepID=A0A840FET5_9SPHN|nr:hypothetical protein [Sphingomonas jinjuensis]MBB4154137.1 hypothetical protein [Sphingomonas jinjuensis]